MIPEDGQFLGPERTNIAFMFRNGQLKGETEEVMSSLEYTAILCKMAGIAYCEQGVEERTPRIFGESERRCAITVREVFVKMQEFYPSTKNAYIDSVEEYGEVLETVVIEDIFMPELLTLLAKNEDAELLSNIFNYFEEIIKKNDSHLINIFSVTVLEILGNDKAVLKVAKQYMGEKTTLLQMKADKELGRL